MIRLRRNFLVKSFFLISLVTVILIQPISVSSKEADKLSRPLIGAIRWDAWTGGRATEQVEKSLGPNQYHFRLPWFSKVLGDNQVKIRGGDQATMDQEINYASEAGIDYWAFVSYPEDSQMSVSLKNYLYSNDKNQLNFCIILTREGIRVSENQWAKNLQWYVKLMKDSNYQKVLNRRPLIYLFYTDIDENKYQEHFGELRQIAMAAGFPSPYLVYMGFNPAQDIKKATKLGFDALSAYAYPGAGTYQKMTQEIEEKYWNISKKIGAKVIPLASTGWDKRPRMDNPVSWESNAPYLKERTYVETATPKEIAQHIERALAWTESNRQSNPADTIIVYAWNEHDEGGWIQPTLNEDGTRNTERLDAIRDMLQNRTMKVQSRKNL